MSEDLEVFELVIEDADKHSYISLALTLFAALLRDDLMYVCEHNHLHLDIIAPEPHNDRAQEVFH